MRTLAPIAAAQGQDLQVEQMAAVGEPPEMIAASFGLTVAELRHRHGDALDHGAVRRRCELIGLMFAAARTGSTPAILWLLKRTEAAAAERASRKAEPPRLTLVS